MAAMPEEGARHTDIHYLEIIKDFRTRSWGSGLTLFRTRGVPWAGISFELQPLHMPVIPNLADCQQESRVNGNQVKAFPALTGEVWQSQQGKPWLAQRMHLNLDVSVWARTPWQPQCFQSEQSLWFSPISSLEYFPLRFTKIFGNGQI